MEKEKIGHLGIDQNGQTYVLGMNPRKELKEKYHLPGKISKMYCDKVDGKTHELGYTIGDFWVNIYSVTNWK